MTVSRLNRGRGVVTVRRVLLAEPASVRKARRLVALVGGVPAVACADAELVVSELVTNALRHASLSRDDRIEVCVTRLETRLRIEVTDGHSFPSAPAETIASRCSCGGFALRIVTSLAAHWHASGGIVTAWIAI